MKNLLDHFRRPPTQEAAASDKGHARESRQDAVKAPARPLQPVPMPMPPAAARAVKPASPAAPLPAEAAKRPPVPADPAAPAEMLTLTLGDFLDRIPAELLDGSDHDRSTPLPFDLGSISERIGRGETAVPIAEIYRRIPDVFRADTVIAPDRVVRFPWKRVLAMMAQTRECPTAPGLTSSGVEMLSIKLRARKFLQPAKVATMERTPAQAGGAKAAESFAPKSLFPASEAPQRTGTPVSTVKTAAAHEASRDSSGTLEQIKAEHARQLAALATERDLALQRVAEFGTEYDAAIARTGEVMADHEAAVARVAELTAERDELTARMAKLAADGEAAVALATEASAERESALARMAELTAERDAVGARTPDLAAGHEATAAQTAEIAAERDAAVARAAEVAAERDAAVARAAEVGAERDAAVARAAETVESAKAAPVTPESHEHAAWESRAAAQFEADIEAYRNTIQALLRERDELRKLLDATSAGETAPQPDAYSTLFPKSGSLMRVAGVVLFAVLGIAIASRVGTDRTQVAAIPSPAVASPTEAATPAVPAPAAAPISDRDFLLNMEASEVSTISNSAEPLAGELSGDLPASPEQAVWTQATLRGAR